MELISLLDGHSRLKIPVTIKNKFGRQRTIPCLIDAGCSTTMIDIRLAKQYGEKLEETATYNLSNKRYETQAYSLEKLMLGSLEINNVFVFAAQYDVKDDLWHSMLLGLNILNNLEYCINRNDNVIRMKENIFSGIPDKNYPYMHWFRINENKEKVYVKLQE